MSVIDLPPTPMTDLSHLSSRTDTAKPNRSCKLIQLSDLHLQQSPNQRYRGYDVERHLQQVLAHIQQHHADLDGLLLSGDLVHHGYADGYRRLVDYLDRLGKPWDWIAGNHDSLDQMRSIRPASTPNIVINGCRLVLLDSCSAPDGRGSGSLAESELQRLAGQLEAAEQTGQAVLVLLHHNPVPLGSRWQDAIMLANADALWELLDPYQMPITLLFGHIHQQYDQYYRGVRLLSCPSTAVQFKAQQPQLMLETEPQLAAPGYRWLSLPLMGADGRCTEVDQQNRDPDLLKTGIERVGLA